MENGLLLDISKFYITHSELYYKLTKPVLGIYRSLLKTSNRETFLHGASRSLFQFQ